MKHDNGNIVISWFIVEWALQDIPWEDMAPLQ